MNKVWTQVVEGQTQVGDEIRVDSGLSKYKQVVTRVTKTTSKCKRQSDGYEFTYQRDIGFHMAKPYEPYSCTTFEVWREVEYRNMQEFLNS